jgi:hypothetical protein
MNQKAKKIAELRSKQAYLIGLDKVYRRSAEDARRNKLSNIARAYDETRQAAARILAKDEAELAWLLGIRQPNYPTTALLDTQVAEATARVNSFVAAGVSLYRQRLGLHLLHSKGVTDRTLSNLEHRFGPEGVYYLPSRKPRLNNLLDSGRSNWMPADLKALLNAER